MSSTILRIIQKTPVKIALAIIFPLLASWAQWSLWGIYLAPFPWQLLFPAVFFSAWAGGLIGGLIATFISVNLGIYFFMEPAFSWKIDDNKQLHSALIFTFNCILISWIHWVFQESQKKFNAISTSLIDQSQSRLRLALKSAHAGLWEWNTDSNENVWSDELWELYNLKPDIAKPSFELWFSTVANEDKQRVLLNIEQAVKQSKDIFLEWRVATQSEQKEKWLIVKR